MVLSRKTLKTEIFRKGPEPRLDAHMLRAYQDTSATTGLDLQMQTAEFQRSQSRQERRAKERNVSRSYKKIEKLFRDYERRRAKESFKGPATPMEAGFENALRRREELHSKK